MEETLRISVRELVAFTYFQEDILPAADVRDLLTGTRAHRARQEKQEGKAECSLKHVFEVAGEGVLVFGRMDAFTDGDEPFVEEIKLSAWKEDGPLPEHRAQALCYAAMVAEEKACERVRFSVCYVNEQGDKLREFAETLDAGVLLAEIGALLAPWVAFAKRERAHRGRRDESLRTLGFPFESYRMGQRELAVQVYTAISRKKRLFASLPTGTGKSAAVLYPALKAMSEGKTGKILYLTARNTARQSPLNALERMRTQGMHARVTVLTAKEKLCPKPARCHPDDCPRAKGHYLRQGKAIDALLNAGPCCWTDEAIIRAADAHNICPFELALALTELADVVLMDMNYAFDPFAQLKRLFQRRRDLTLLIDEAHHAVERVRESLSGELDSRELSRLRADFGKAAGRKNAYYRALSDVIRILRALAPAENVGATGNALDAYASEAGRKEAAGSSVVIEERLQEPPEGVVAAAQRLLDEALALFAHPVRDGAAMAGVSETVRLCLPFLYAAEHLDEDYAVLLSGRGRERALLLYCLLPAKEITRVTKTMRGTVFFSATLTPLPAMKQLLGGGEEDACFSLPSPFPPSHLAVVRRRVSTRYLERENSAETVAASIAEAVEARPGKYIAYFPSYAYLRLVLERLDESALPPLWVQQRDMGDEDRENFLAAFEAEETPKLGLCVLGGLFSEGIDLPGDRLVGVIVVGVGLPTPSQRLRAIQACYARHFGDGFAYACRIPAMHKVLQAGGRVIRTDEDRGLILLLDERYYQRDYEALLPPEWHIRNENLKLAVRELEEAQ